MIADTWCVATDWPTIMKGFGYLAHRPSDEATEDATAPSDQHRKSLKRVGSVLLVAAILACIHREISGAIDGSLLSVVTSYANGALHHVASVLLNRGP